MHRDEVIQQIADSLGETEARPRAQIAAIVDAVGEIGALGLLAQTEKVEKGGGMMLPDGSRRRTPGGVFLRLARKVLNAEQRAVIFAPVEGAQPEPKIAVVPAAPPSPPPPPVATLEPSAIGAVLVVESTPPPRPDLSMPSASTLVRLPRGPRVPTGLARPQTERPSTASEPTAVRPPEPVRLVPRHEDRAAPVPTSLRIDALEDAQLATLLRRIRELHLSDRAFKPVQAIGAVYLGDLVRCTRTQLGARGSGQDPVIAEIELRLASQGLHLGTQLVGWPLPNPAATIKRLTPVLDMLRTRDGAPLADLDAEMAMLLSGVDADASRAAVAARLGLDGRGGTTLDVAGRPAGLTGERVRQLCARLAQRWTECPPALPHVRRAIAQIVAETPAPADQIEANLAASGLVRPGFRVEGILAAVWLLGEDADVRVHTIDGVRQVVRASDLHEEPRRAREASGTSPRTARESEATDAADETAPSANELLADESWIDRLEASVRELAHGLVHDLESIVRTSLIESVRRHFDEPGEAPAAAAKRPERVNGAPARRAAKPVKRVMTLDDRLVAFVTEHPGRRIEEIATEVKAPMPALRSAIARLVASGHLTTSGKARGTRYHAARGAPGTNAPANGESASRPTD